jgi:23S rRNA (uracil1939-C5)-methyltransferase
MMEQVTIDKLVHGGQGLATLADGRKVFVWNALPGETVQVRLTKQKRSYAEGIAETIIKASPDRVEPVEANYLATSPWQIMTYDAENIAKAVIVNELFKQEGVTIPEQTEATHSDQQWRYRNKMEYSFWGDDNGLSLALYRRGTHGKEVLTGSELAMRPIDRAAGGVLHELQKLNTHAGDLKTIVIRSSQHDQAVAALFVKTKSFFKLKLPAGLQGLRVYYSNPKSPASVSTKLLQELGDATLQDELLGKTFSYDVDSFFQVNLPVFELALTRIKDHCAGAAITDMYAGVGSIGLSVAHERVNLIDIDDASTAMARVNATASNLDAEVIQASTEKVLEYISGAEPVIFDPPRSGLHDKVVERLLEALPQQIAYLSCNPATQARDLAKLQGSYQIDYFETFNFFPRTPHIETLAILSAKTT